MSTTPPPIAQDGLLEFCKSSPQQTLTQVIEQTLKDHQLVRKLIPESELPCSLMKALSDQLYFTSLHFKAVQDKCVAYAKELLQQQTVPSKLKSLKTQFEEYSKNPSQPKFDTVNLELISLVFERKIVVYSMSKELILKSLLFNNRYVKTIQIINLSGHYDSIYHEDNLEIHTICQDILYSALNLGDKGDSGFFNIAYELHLDAISNATQNEETFEEGDISEQEKELIQKEEKKHTEQSPGMRERNFKKSNSKNVTDSEESEGNSYHLFENHLPPDDLFDQILFKERKNSIAEYVKHKKSTLSNSSQVSPSKSQGHRTQNILQRGAPKKGLGLTLNSVKDLIKKQNNDDDRSSDSDEDESPELKSAEGEKQNSENKKETKKIDKKQSLISQDEDAQLIQEAINLERVRNESMTSYVGVINSSSSISNQASFQAFSSQNNIGINPPQLMSLASANNLVLNAPNAIIAQGSGISTYPTIKLDQSVQPQSSSKVTQQEQQGQPGKTQPNGIYQQSIDINQQSSQPIFTQGSNAPDHPFNGVSQVKPLQQVDSSQHVIIPLQQQRKKATENGQEKKYQGTLKFFDYDNNYGFIVEEETKQDVFLHLDDLQKAGIPKTIMFDHKNGKQVRFQFGIMLYFGKYRESIKAVDLQLLSDNPPFLPLTPAQLRLLAAEQYFPTPYPSYYATPGNIPQIMHQPQQGDINVQQSPYYPPQFNPAYLAPGGIPFMMGMQQPPSPTGLQMYPHGVQQLNYNNLQPSPPSLFPQTGQLYPNQQQFHPQPQLQQTSSSPHQSLQI